MNDIASIVSEAYENAIVNEYLLDEWTAEEVAMDMKDGIKELENVRIEYLIKLIEEYRNEKNL